MVSIESKSIISLFTGIIGIGIVLFLSYYATKFIGKKSIKGKNRGNIKNVDNYYMGADKFLSIVKVGESYLLLGISNDRERGFGPSSWRTFLSVRRTLREK